MKTKNEGIMGGKFDHSLKTLYLQNFVLRNRSRTYLIPILSGKKQFTDDSKSFSTCSKAAMIATLQKIHGQEQKKKDDGKATCLKFEVLFICYFIDS